MRGVAASLRLCIMRVTANDVCILLLLPVNEACHAGLRFIQLFLHLPSPVEDWTVPTRAQHVLMQRALTSLTLRPQVAIVRFELCCLHAH